ncbi:MAG: type I DNA topoisomerase [Actinomycetota bacterium]
MPAKLVIVESPAKARTIAGFLGTGFVVESSLGHVRDLPEDAADIPEKLRGEDWARLGVDVQHGFKPLYVEVKSRRSQITKLRRLVKNAEELYLATDEDREGESIAWHLVEALRPRVPVRRLVFHEITPGAIRAALQAPREVDRRLVDAQETRRILDRLFGYEVSPVLWKMVGRGLSAGRVQSPAIRIVVERERERMAFRSAAYWDVEGAFATRSSEPGRFGATLVGLGGKRVASGKDFDASGRARNGGVAVLDRAAAEGVVADLAEAAFAVRSVERKPYRRSPYAPFRTATLQQEAGRQLRFSTDRTMRTAQSLYEGGYITYMRTDSVALSETAVAAARALIAARFGREYLPSHPRVYRNRVRNAQEAHEAIRPAGESFRDPEEVAGAVPGDQARLYELIWKRTVASQMADAAGESVAVRLGAAAASGVDAEFGTAGKVISFPGFLRAYVEGSDDPDAELEDQERRLPALAEGDPLDAEALEARGHETKAPARYTEASLVRRLEELGIGRPSTYASIISTIQKRGYVWKKGPALVPSFTAFATVQLLERHFADLIDYQFTARMEDDLDRISTGEQEVIPYLSDFYFGDGHRGLTDLVGRSLEEGDPRAICAVALGDAEGSPVVRVGRYGPYLEVGESRVSLPDDLAPDELTIEKALAMAEEPSGDRVLGTDPDTGSEVLVRQGRFGPYVQLGRTGETAGKPLRASLFASMMPESVTLDEALRLLSLPRVVGTDPGTGEAVVARNGKFGPYLERAGETRNLDSEEQIFTVTLDEALARLAAPKARRGARQAAAGPLRSLGVDPETGCTIEVRDGRFGPYVTDGAVNASLRREDAVEQITLERARDLLTARRERLAAEGKQAKPRPPAPGGPGKAEAG